MNIQIISLFPEMFLPILNSSMLHKAQEKEIVSFSYINLRDYGKGPRKQVDDTPYGGGDGMLLMVEPLVLAIEAAKENSPNSLVILPSPRGEMYNQANAKEIASAQKDLILICPRYEGYDERILNWVDCAYCVGPYILTGGEIPAMIIIDTIVRLIPGVLGGAHSIEIESFHKQDNYIEYPQYTRPNEFRGISVPEVLLSGNHRQIKAWRQQESKEKTVN